MADGDAVEIPAKKSRRFLWEYRHGNLGGLTLDESSMASYWAMPASNEPRVRVLEKKNSIANTLSRK